MTDWSSLLTKGTSTLIQKGQADSSLIDDQKFRSEVIIPDAVATYHPKRREEFLWGRWCANECYKKLTGQSIHQLEIGEYRNPLWPQGFVGSITHNENWVMATMASSQDLQGIGIDFEGRARVKPEISRMIMTEKDLTELDGLERNELLTLIFSAKESLYKCLYPSVQAFFGFDSAAVTQIDLATSTFQIELLLKLSDQFGPQRKSRFEGSFKQSKLDLLTVIELPNT